MDTAPKHSEEPRLAYRFDAIPEDEEAQDALNRRLRKPGEPGYCPPANKTDLSQQKSNSVDDSAEVERS